jgi:hypothetical protein
MRDAIKSVNGVEYLVQPSSSYGSITGTLNDWAYGEKGILPITIELRPSAGKEEFKLPTDQIEPTFRENLEAALYFIGLSRGRLIDFEDGTDQQPIHSTIEGMAFTTTAGYDWVYGDEREPQYNVQPAPDPNGPYACNGHGFAWLGPNQGLGRIDFTDNGYKTVGLSYSSSDSTFLEAYDVSGELMELASGPGNIGTGQLGRLAVTGNIAYVFVHDTGNYWLVDDLFVTDALADAQSRVPGKYRRDLEVVEEPFVTGQTKEFTVFIKEGGDLKIVLQWHGSMFRLKVIDPDGRIAAKEQTAAPP